MNLRTPATFNPGSFTPSEAEAKTIATRQAFVRRVCREMMADERFVLHGDPTNRRSLHGALYVLPIMWAKAAIIDNGWNVLHQWHWFEVEMALPWGVRFWNSSAAMWASVGTLLESQFHATDTDGTLLSGGLWAPVRVTEMRSFAAIPEDEALYWIGEIGGEPPHIEHPEGTLRMQDQVLTVVAGATLMHALEAYLGKPPYRFAPEGAPLWVRTAGARLTADPPASTRASRVTFTVACSDAVPQTVRPTFHLDVTAATT